MSPCTSSPCSSNYFLYLPLLDSLFSFVLHVYFLSSFSELCCQPASWSFSAVSRIPPTYTWFSISGFTNLSLPKSPFIHLSSFFQAHLLTNCFSCHCSNSSHGILLPPYPVQPVTPLLRSIIMAQYRNAELRTRSIMLLLLFRQFCE